MVAHAENDNYALSRIDDQIGWYESMGNKHRTLYFSFRSVAILIGIFLAVGPSTFVADADLSSEISRGLGALFLAVESTLQLSRSHDNWIVFKSTAERLKSERALYCVAAGPYEIDAREQLLAIRTERIISREVHSWAKSQTDSGTSQLSQSNNSPDLPSE